MADPEVSHGIACLRREITTLPHLHREDCGGVLSADPECGFQNIHPEMQVLPWPPGSSSLRSQPCWGSSLGGAHTSGCLLSLNRGVHHTCKVRYELGAKKERNKATMRAVSFQLHKQVIHPCLEVTIATVKL